VHLDVHVTAPVLVICKPNLSSTTYPGGILPRKFRGCMPLLSFLRLCSSRKHVARITVSNVTNVIFDAPAPGVSTVSLTLEQASQNLHLRELQCNQPACVLSISGAVFSWQSEIVLHQQFWTVLNRDYLLC